MPSSPIAILGMHRSHTSLCAGMLDKCGVELGSEHFFPSSEDNPEGYFEDERFLDINDGLLQAMGGSWENPPALPPRWFTSEALAKLRDQAADLVRVKGTDQPWGWKDPRTCLTLEVWRDLLPDLRAVLCIRHPAEVAYSLMRRRYNSMPREDGLALWLQYHEIMLPNLETLPHIVSHTDSFFTDPGSEFKRIVAFLELHPSEETFAAAAGMIRGGLKRTAAIDYSLPADVMRVYSGLCEAAGRPSEVPDDNFWEASKEQLEAAIAELREAVAAKSRWERSSRTTSAQLEERAATLELELRASADANGNLQRDLERLRAENERQRAYGKELDEELHRLQQTFYFRVGIRLRLLKPRQ
jgi:hypothetical protein